MHQHTAELPHDEDWILTCVPKATALAPAEDVRELRLSWAIVSCGFGGELFPVAVVEDFGLGCRKKAQLFSFGCLGCACLNGAGSVPVKGFLSKVSGSTAVETANMASVHSWLTLHMQPPASAVAGNGARRWMWLGGTGGCETREAKTRSSVCDALPRVPASDIITQN